MIEIIFDPGDLLLMDGSTEVEFIRKACATKHWVKMQDGKQIEVSKYRLVLKTKKENNALLNTK